MQSKKLFRLMPWALIIFLGCQKEPNENINNTAGNLSGPSYRGNHLPAMRMGDQYSQPITRDTANRMIQSYLTSINYPQNQEGLRSLAIDADTLRAYLKDNNIVTLKFMIAHRPEYINSGNYGVNAGGDLQALTLIVVGVDEGDKYIYARENFVYEHLQPCPTYCSGTSVTLN
jgi:hypothetical protein